MREAQTRIFIGFPPAVLTFLNQQAVLRQRFRRLQPDVGAGFRKRKRQVHKFVPGGARLRNLLIGRMQPIQPAQIASLYRYPVKGLSPEPLHRIALRVGETLPADRRYAVENGPSGFDPAAPVWMAKSHFLMLMRDERLAGLRSNFDDHSNLLTIRENDVVVARGDLESAEGRAAIEAFFATNFASELRGPPKVIA